MNFNRKVLAHIATNVGLRVTDGQLAGLGFHKKLTKKLNIITDAEVFH